MRLIHFIPFYRRTPCRPVRKSYLSPLGSRKSSKHLQKMTDERKIKEEQWCSKLLFSSSEPKQYNPPNPLGIDTCIETRKQTTYSNSLFLNKKPVMKAKRHNNITIKRYKKKKNSHPKPLPNEKLLPMNRQLGHPYLVRGTHISRSIFMLYQQTWEPSAISQV